MVFTKHPDSVSFFGTLLGSTIGVLGAYLIFSMENRKRDNDELECLLALLKFTVNKVDRVLSNPGNIKSKVSVKLNDFAYEIVYDKEWYKYLRLIDSYEDKESIVKFIDYIQRDKYMLIGDLIAYRDNIVNILKKYNKYDSSLDREDLYNRLKDDYKKEL
ncbi:MAG: hypothetical protein ACRCXT_11865 [Paraclostridium sp.]